AMAFPVRDVSALPFRAPTTDEALFGDMADMHVERLGMRPGVDAGILSDYFKVGSRGEESLLLPVVLAPPPEGHLPKRAPQSFDISARCLPLPSDGVVVWRELGRWVFALSEEGQPLHFQALAATKLGEDAGREIRLSLSQLQIQGLIDKPPKHCFVWLGEGEAAPLDDELAGLGLSFGGVATVAAKPAPVIPDQPSQLLPADVRAERMAKRKKQQAITAVVVGVLAYLGVIGWAAWVLFQERKRVAEISKDYDEVAPLVEGINSHTQKWDELQPVTDLKHWPVELMLNCSKARPDQGLRLERAEVFNQLNITDQGNKELVRSIRLQGKADELEQVNTFNLNLKDS
ncbi:MAG: hypothetical protein GWO24_01615, partial [Akkermansiaceae bacterium]|nr:hypothetical protein [Akkermansiaceae bacterium]